MRYSICTIGMFVGMLALARVAHAQTQFPTPEPAPPPPPAAPVAPPVQAAQSVQPVQPVQTEQPAQCFPACRSGYLCISGQCVSKCNPPCGDGERCQDGECIAAPAPGSVAPPDPGIERHDGFMLRFTLGLGYGSTRVTPDSSVSDDELVLRGLAGSFAFDIGGAPVENFVLHARFSDLVVVDPTVSLNGDEVGEEDTNLAGFFFGPAFTYYFMPANVYLTAALGLSWLSADDDGTEARDSDVGFGSNLDVGKEWWVSDNWGLGLAARFWLTYLKDTQSGIDVSYTLLGFAVMFSATYN